MKTQPQRQTGIPRPKKRRIIKKIVTKKLKPKLKTDAIVATVQKPVIKKVTATVAKKVPVKSEVIAKRKPGRPFKVKDNATIVKKPAKWKEMAKKIELAKKEVASKGKEVPKPKIVAKTKPVPKLVGGKVIKVVPKVKPVIKRAVVKKVGKIETLVQNVDVEKIKVEDIPKTVGVEKIEPSVVEKDKPIEKEVIGKDSGNETISKLLKEASKSLGQPIKKKAPVKPKKIDPEKDIKVIETKPEKDVKVSEKEIKGAEKKVSEKEGKEKEIKAAEKKISEKEGKEKEAKAADKKICEKDVKDKEIKAPGKEVKTAKSVEKGGKNVEKEIKITEKVSKDVKSAEKVVKEVKVAKNIEKEVKNVEAKSLDMKPKITKVNKINPCEASDLKKIKIPDTKIALKKQEVPDKIKQEEYDEDESDEQPLSTKVSPQKSKTNEKPKVKIEPESEPDQSSETADDNKPLTKSRKRKSSKLLLKKRLLKEIEEQKVRKLVSFWNGPKRHREASLNALAKVHCLYENESRGAFMELLKPKRAPSDKTTDSEPPSPPSQRNLRSTPGVRSGPGKHWDMTTSSSEERSSSPESYENQEYKPSKKVYVKSKPTPKKEKPPPKTPAKRRNRTEIVMDLKDMVVRKRMASLNATAILAASYSPEKCSSKSSSDDDSSDESDNSDSTRGKGKRHHYEKDKVISNKKKVSVIVNQDTDVTITGVYVNSTTRSTHLHEGYCSIAGMQYMISATSHTQTNATAVSTETLLRTSPHEDQVSLYFKGYYCDDCRFLLPDNSTLLIIQRFFYIQITLAHKLSQCLDLCIGLT